MPGPVCSQLTSDMGENSEPPVLSTADLRLMTAKLASQPVAWFHEQCVIFLPIEMVTFVTQQ